MGDKNLVRHDRTGAQHLGASHSDPFAVFVDDLHHRIVIVQLGHTLGTVDLWVNDDVSEVEIVIARMDIVFPERPGAILVISLEDIEPH